MQSSSSSGALSMAEFTLVFFDLETTGLDVALCDIVQISAICGERSFNAYVLPRCSIAPDASRVTGFTVRDQALLLRGLPVDTVPLRQALAAFIAFLRSVDRPLLAGHNAKRFDCPVLARALRELSLREDFLRAAAGLLDTLPLSKDLLPYDVVGHYSQQHLVSFCLNKKYEAHNALEDVRALQELYQSWGPDPSAVRRHVFALSRVCA